jgi:amino acid adenylation domain-containing protein
MKYNRQHSTEEDLANLARDGDKSALAELRRRGYFTRLKEEGRACVLSHPQLRLWLLERLGADSSAYNLPAVYRVAGDMDTDALAKAFVWLSTRHGQLRVSFPETNGNPRQIVEAAHVFQLPFAIHEAENFPAALAHVQAWTAKGFSLSQAPLWRAAWWRTGGEDGLFAWVFHHAIADEWSLDLLATELAHAYAAYRVGNEPDRPFPSVSYFDWTESEAAYSAGPDGERERDWWLTTLSPLPEPIELPADFPRPAERSFSAGVVESNWPDAVTHGIARIARAERVTPFAMAMALTRAFLYRLCGQDDAVIGFPHANRDMPGAESVCGFMANTLVLRRRFDPEANFSENLRRESEGVRNAINHGRYPFDLLVEATNPPRDASRSPLFDVMATIRASGANTSGFSAVHSGYTSARFDVVFEWKEADGILTGLDLTYAASLFKPERMREWLLAMETMIKAIVAKPDRMSATLPLLDASGQAEALAKAQGPVAKPPWEGTDESPLQWLWNKQVRTHPDCRAIEDRNGGWSFSELDAASRSMTAALRRKGVQSGDRVVSSLSRSRHLAATLWGIWRTGAVYVPIDPAWPSERKRFVIEDSGARLVVAQTASDALGADWLAPEDAWGKEEDLTVSEAWTTDGLAYIIYTSGSTGVPKGVAVPPQGVVNMALAQAAVFGLSAADRALAMASTAFDASMAEMLAGWAVGACVVAAPEDIASDIKTLAAWLPQSQATLATVTPALLSLIPGSAFAGVRTLLTAGEAAHGGDLCRLLGNTRIFNAYGPTECSVCATLYEVTAPDCDGTTSVPIGFPLTNIAAHVLDADGQPCLPDTPGNLFLEGIGLAKGYWNRPELTESSFRSHAQIEGKVLYQTGDRARRRRDGALVFLGRLDDQVKIRGHRVETGEVARALADALLDTATTVLAYRDTRGETELVAFVAGSDEQIATARHALAERLPSPLRPTRYLAVDKLPRDANGKIDRKALPALLANVDSAVPAGREPSRPLEAEILAAWRTALGHSNLSLTDDFFLAGGHSLSSLRAAALTAEKTGLVVTGRDILTHPTAEGLAAALALRIPGAEKQPPIGGETKNDAVLDRPLEQAIRDGEMPPLDAAALGYFPDHPPAGFPDDLWTRQRVIQEWCGGEATLLHIYDTCYGRTGLIALPLFHTDLFGDADRLMASVRKGMSLAKNCQARSVVLTGMLPSATHGGEDVTQRFPVSDWPVVTHGHATTAAALLKGAERLLDAAGRDWSTATAGFLGLGSVGGLACRLWLEARPWPRRLILADIPAKRPELDKLADEWKTRTQGKVCIDIVESPSTPPDIWYEADLMLCAVGAGEVVDINRLRPGTLLADDSAPPCFSWQRAAERMRRTGDILAIESGDIALPAPWRRTSYRPEGLRKIFPKIAQPHPDDARRMTSCVLSGLLLAQGRAACRQTIGQAPLAQAYEHFLGLGRLGMTAPAFRCGEERPNGVLRIGRSGRGGKPC